MKELIIHQIQQMLPYISVIAVAFVISCLLTPLAIRLAPKIGAMDIPRDGRRMHKKAMPRFGGMAIFAGTEIALAVFCRSDPEVLTILLGGALIYAVGVIDDLKGLPAKLKFLLQILCATAVYIGGIRIDFVKNPFDMGESYINFPLPVSLLITVIWIVGITNTINLIDGLDGLAAGVAVIASGYISYAAILSGQYGVGLAMFAVTGGALGFLPFNFHPAKIFMGDGGSLYLGFMIASISVLGSTKGATLIVTLVPFLALGLPIFDTAFAIIRRWINGTPIMEADKGHVHHRIMGTGIGQRRTVLIMYCISAIMGMVSIMVVKREAIEAIVLTITAAILLCVFVADHPRLREITQEKGSQKAAAKPHAQQGDGNGAVRSGDPEELILKNAASETEVPKPEAETLTGSGPEASAPEAFTPGETIEVTAAEAANSAAAGSDDTSAEAGRAEAGSYHPARPAAEAGDAAVEGDAAEAGAAAAGESPEAGENAAETEQEPVWKGENER